MLNKKNYLKNHDDLFYDFIKFVTYLKYFKLASCKHHS